MKEKSWAVAVTSYGDNRCSWTTGGLIGSEELNNGQSGPVVELFE